MKTAIQACQEKLSKYLDEYESAVRKIEALTKEEQARGKEIIGHGYFYDVKFSLEKKIKELTRAIMYLKAVE